MTLQESIMNRIHSHHPLVLAVAAGADTDVLLSVKNAQKLGLIKPVLFGNIPDIESIALTVGFDTAHAELVQADSAVSACELAVQHVSSGHADLLMKGLVDTSVLLKAVLNKDWGLRTDKVLSHVTVFQLPDGDKIRLISDAAMNIAPDLIAKKQIIENCLPIATSLGMTKPNVAVLCAVEKVNPKMQATLDAEALSTMNLNGEITGCYVDGPFALDNAVSETAAHHKGIDNPRAGHADILLVPDIEAGNMLYKSITYFAHGSVACVVSGARCPIVLTSRADSDEAKLNSIALAVLLASKKA